MRKIDYKIAYHINHIKPAKLGGLYEIKYIESDDTVELWYRGTKIFYYRGKKDGNAVYLQNGGYLTKTTKEKINAALMGVLPLSYQVYQKDYTWYLSNPNGADWEWTTDKMLIKLDERNLPFSVASV